MRLLAKKQKDIMMEVLSREVYLRLLQDVKTYSLKWKLFNFHFINHFSMNYIFKCESEIYGVCILKIGGNYDDSVFLLEYNVLKEYNGKRYVSVYESDINLNADNKIIKYLENSLNVPSTIIRQCFYIEQVTYECWSASFYGSYDISNSIFAEKIMNFEGVNEYV
jgi:hypothetical protein